MRRASYSFRNLVTKFRSFYKSGSLSTSRGTYFGRQSPPTSHGATTGSLCPPPKRRPRAQCFPLFGPLQKDLARKRFAADIDVKQSVTSWPQTLDTHLFYPRIKDLVPRWNKYLHVSGEYLEFLCVPSATTVPCTHWSLVCTVCYYSATYIPKSNYFFWPHTVVLDTFFKSTFK